nr:vegetative cell wall protein gp1-like [Lolium perenne]
MGSNSPPVDTIAATSTAATNITSTAMTGAHALQGAAAAANGDQAVAVPTGLDLLPATLADLADSLRAIRSSSRRSGPASTRRPHHPPFRRRPRPTAVPPPPPPAAATPPPPPPASAASQGRPAWWPPSPSPIPTWTDAAPVYTHTAPRTTVQPPAHRPGGPGGFAGPFAASTSINPSRQADTPEVPPVAPQPPRFTKLEFATYDGATDPRTG